MSLSAEHLRQEAAATGFRPEILEKVDRLLDLLELMQRHPYLKWRLVLKGGTALNLFVFDVPRLSVDIDVNYIGAVDRETMLAERQPLENAIEAVAGRLDLTLQRAPEAHAGGKWRLRYASVLGQGGTLELDITHVPHVALANPTPGFQGSGHEAGTRDSGTRCSRTGGRQVGGTIGARCKPRSVRCPPPADSP